VWTNNREFKAVFSGSVVSDRRIVSGAIDYSDWTRALLEK
jgi:hypothetical protein